jgi:hypothetical protein
MPRQLWQANQTCHVLILVVNKVYNYTVTAIVARGQQEGVQYIRGAVVR